MKLLIIEDELDLLDSVAKFFVAEGFFVETAMSYALAEEKVDLYRYDCVIIDITLPGGSGLDIIHKLKKLNSDTGIIIISAKDSLEDKLTGLNIGADDYLAKPFHLSELNARVKSIIRRRGFSGSNEICFNEIKVFFDKREVEIKGRNTSLTRKEYDLLLYFIMNKEKVLSREMIAEHLWGDDMSLIADSFDFIYTHIKNLRKKILDNGCNDYIQTVYGIGYKFSEN